MFYDSFLLISNFYFYPLFITYSHKNKFLPHSLCQIHQLQLSLHSPVRQQTNKMNTKHSLKLKQYEFNGLGLSASTTTLDNLPMKLFLFRA